MTPEEHWRERELAALESIAATLDVIAATLGAMHAGFGGATLACAHPITERQDLGSTMGHPRWRCKVCGYEVQT